MKFGVFCGETLIRPFKTKEDADRFSERTNNSIVFPIQWEKDARYTAGGHYIPVAQTGNETRTQGETK